MVCMKRIQHARIMAFPYHQAVSGGRLETVAEQVNGARRELILDFHELAPFEPPALALADGRPRERVRGEYRPKRLRFQGVTWLHCSGLYENLAETPPDHPARCIHSLLHWSPPGSAPMFLVVHGAAEPAQLALSASACRLEERPGAVEPVDLLRDCSPPPPMKPGIVPSPRWLHRCFGGDPVSICLGGRVFTRRLFAGGLETQGEHRPEVDAVLNLGELPSRWAVKGSAWPADRWSRRGEGLAGMSPAEIVEETQWVLERLNAGQRVLVHCSAGLNRSVTVCAAAVMLQEGLSAEAALARVREHHPWARPDGYHWLALKWLAKER